MNWTEEISYDPEYIINNISDIEISKDEKIKELEERIKLYQTSVFLLICCFSIIILFILSLI